MHTLTRDEAKQAGYTGYAEHLTTVPCPRLTDKNVYCATCQGALAQLSGEAREVADTRSAATKLHKWVKAPRSLMAAFVCSVCGRDSMVKHYGRCSSGR